MSTSTLARPRAFSPEFVIPAHAVQRSVGRGIEIADMRDLGFLAGIAGGAGGFNTTGDLITSTTDGVDLNTLWNEFQTVNDEYNAARQAVVDFLTYSVNNPVEDVPVLGTQGDFEEASEFGVPRSYRPEFDTYAMGFGFKWYDLANRFTWQFLAEAPAAQVRAIENQALEADSRLVFTKVMRQLFRNVTDSATIRGNAYNVYGFYNGDANSTPPAYAGTTFAAGHNHFMVSGGTVVDQFDLQDMQEQLVHHGYNRVNGYRTVLMANRADTTRMRAFRSEQNGGPAGALWDFIPAQGQPASLLDVTTQIINGGPAAAQLDGLNVIGTYGDIIIVEEDYIPAGYLVMFVTGGRDNLQNPIGFREHQNAGLRGMRLVKGRNADYPLLDAYYVRGFGTGVRQRGAGVVMQIKATGTYAPPAAFA
jgi:hypothetical protein